ncbi:hypothetical protein BC827DRAFT_1234504 [Russula dissimulans]|nr:hypothetical protein BC827DRAFT_1234504 [Russula dissimulans]
MDCLAAMALIPTLRSPLWAPSLGKLVNVVGCAMLNRILVGLMVLVLWTSLIQCCAATSAAYRLKHSPWCDRHLGSMSEV